MTSDDRLLLRIDRIKDWLNAVGNHADAIWIEETIARIRELEAELEELDFLRHEGHTDSVAMMELQLKGVKAGTHVIVPVEPTEAMLEASWDAKDDGTNVYIYRAMIRSAQPDASD